MALKVLPFMYSPMAVDTFWSITPMTLSCVVTAVRGFWISIVAGAKTFLLPMLEMPNAAGLLAACKSALRSLTGLALLVRMPMSQPAVALSVENRFEKLRLMVVSVTSEKMTIENMAIVMPVRPLAASG